MIWSSRTFSMLGCTVLITETEHPEQFENCSQRSGNSFTAASRASAMLFGIDSTRAKPAPVVPAHSMNSRRLTGVIGHLLLTVAVNTRTSEASSNHPVYVSRVGVVNGSLVRGSH